MLKEVLAKSHRSKQIPHERPADPNQPAIKEVNAEPNLRFPRDWADRARQGIHDRRTRPDE
jgi:hypothetical protein